MPGSSRSTSGPGDLVRRFNPHGNYLATTTGDRGKSGECETAELPVNLLLTLGRCGRPREVSIDTCVALSGLGIDRGEGSHGPTKPARKTERKRTRLRTRANPLAISIRPLRLARRSLRARTWLRYSIPRSGVGYARSGKVKQCQGSSTPPGRCWPKSWKRSFELTTRSLTVLDTMVCEAVARPSMRVVMWTPQACDVAVTDRIESRSHRSGSRRAQLISAAMLGFDRRT